MALKPLAGHCPDGRTCPAAWKTDRDTVAIRGYQLPDADLKQIVLPDGETVTEVPIAILEEALRAYRSTTG